MAQHVHFQDIGDDDIPPDPDMEDLRILRAEIDTMRARNNTMRARVDAMNAGMDIARAGLRGVLDDIPPARDVGEIGGGMPHQMQINLGEVREHLRITRARMDAMEAGMDIGIAGLRAVLDDISPARDVGEMGDGMPHQMQINLGEAREHLRIMRARMDVARAGLRGAPDDIPPAPAAADIAPTEDNIPPADNIPPVANIPPAEDNIPPAAEAPAGGFLGSLKKNLLIVGACAGIFIAGTMLYRHFR